MDDFFSLQYLINCTGRFIFQEAKKRQCPVEIIYLSSDTDAEAMLRHFKEEHHGWYAVPINEVTVTEMHWKYNITCEPQIVVVRRNGDIVTRKGKEDLLNLGINVLVKWLVPHII
ncbi:nucleoredoxin-like protein 2 [Holotrichia oblita]|uniref:Nucleoredoxin-like protein 2 n=1 Tax=Holotrichia oblita TaxID=644536 RepID=A0ACB9TM92_HOLOL|nr:nucleoredoxin-like protein 2 [Holotrichia oblita]